MSRPSWNNLTPQNTKLILQLLSLHELDIGLCLDYEKQSLERIGANTEQLNKNIQEYLEDLEQLRHIQHSLNCISPDELTNNEWD